MQLKFNKNHVLQLAALTAVGGTSWWVGKQSAKEKIIYRDPGGEKYIIPTPKSVKPYTAHYDPIRINEVMRFGYPSQDNIRLFNDFVLAYDNRNRIPYWTCEHLTKDSVKKVGEVTREQSQFKEDYLIDDYFKAYNTDYARSGYDRGHLAAAGNHMLKQVHCDETFTLSNIAPQVGNGFNRHSWNRLEKFVRRLAREHANVYVYTGPLFLEVEDGITKKKYVKYEVIGKNNVAVPTHFFKIIIAEKNNGSLGLLSFIMPNRPIPDETPLSQFYAPLDTIKSRSGLYFGGIPTNKISEINKAKI